MKFAVALTFASSAMAGLVVRDATYVTDVMTTVGKDIDAVKDAADAYSGDKTDLVKAADQLISDLKDGQTKVAAGDDLDLNDAITLKPAVDDLTEKGTALTKALKDKKDQVEKANECKTVQDDISAIYTNSQALIKAVIAKVPEGPARDLAAQLAGQLNTVLEEAQSAYEDCTDANGGGGSSTGTGSATPTGTGSATPTGTGSVTKTTGTGSATKPTATATHPIATGTDCATSTGGVKPTGTNPTVPSGAAALYAPAGILAAAAAALAL